MRGFRSIEARPDPKPDEWPLCSVCLQPVAPGLLVEWHARNVDLILHPLCIQELNLQLLAQVMVIRERERRQHQATPER